MKIKNFLRRILLKVLKLIDTPSAATSKFPEKRLLPAIPADSEEFYLDEILNFNIEGTPSGIAFQHTVWFRLLCAR